MNDKFDPVGNKDLRKTHKKTKPDCQSQNVNHNTKKVSLGPNTSR